MHDNIAFFLSDKALCRFNEESGFFSQYGSVLGLKRKGKMSILGPNGSGKSTLMKLFPLGVTFCWAMSLYFFVRS